MSLNSLQIMIALAAVAAVAAIAGCSHAMPERAPEAGSPAGDDDPVRVRGSVTGGPVLGKPAGPYAPR
jgi:hypothetical protein